MEILSDECIVNVMKYLEASDFVNICLISSRFSTFCYDQQIWRYFFLRDFAYKPEIIAIYERIIGKIVDWKTAYSTVNTNIALRSQDFILAIKLLLPRAYSPNERIKFEKEYGILYLPEISEVGDISFIISDNTKNGILLKTFRSARIACDAHTVGSKYGNLYLFIIHGVVGYNREDLKKKKYWYFNFYTHENYGVKYSNNKFITKLASN